MYLRILDLKTVQFRCLLPQILRTAPIPYQKLNQNQTSHLNITCLLFLLHLTETLMTVSFTFDISLLLVLQYTKLYSQLLRKSQSSKRQKLHTRHMNLISNFPTLNNHFIRLSFIVFFFFSKSLVTNRSSKRVIYHSYNMLGQPFSFSFFFFNIYIFPISSS